jgi:hypothetical protein
MLGAEIACRREAYFRKWLGLSLALEQRSFHD